MPESERVTDLWLIFVVTYGGPATVSVFHAVMTLIFLGAWGLRLRARHSR